MIVFSVNLDSVGLQTEHSTMNQVVLPAGTTLLFLGNYLVVLRSNH